MVLSFRVIGQLFFIYHCRFRSLSLSKATELSWYCLFGCASLLSSFYRHQFRSLLSTTVTEISWYCTLGYSLGLQFFTGSSVIHWAFSYSLGLQFFTGSSGNPSTTTGSACLHSEGRRTTVVLYLWDLANSVFNLNISPQNCGSIDDCFFYFWLPPTRGIVHPVAFAFFVIFSTTRFHRPPNGEGRRTVALQYFLTWLLSTYVYVLFTFSDPAYLLHRYFLLPTLFSEHETRFRSHASVAVFQVFRLAHFD